MVTLLLKVISVPVMLKLPATISAGFSVDTAPLLTVKAFVPLLSVSLMLMEPVLLLRKVSVCV